MMPAPAVAELFERRENPLKGVAEDAEAVARACHAMAARFHAGGKLLVFGNGSAAADAQHITVEFVHPVIVGKRALPAIGLAADLATVTGLANQVGFAEVHARQIRLLADPSDIALGISSDGECRNVRSGLQAARQRGLLTIALLGGDGGAIARDRAVDHVLLARSRDPRVVKEAHVTTYHILWELTHVFGEHPDLLHPAAAAAADRPAHAARSEELI